MKPTNYGKKKKKKCVHSTSVPSSRLFCACCTAVFFFLYYAVFFFLSFRHVLMTGANCLAQKQVANNVLRKNTCKKTPVRIFICVMSARTTNSCCCLAGKRYYVTAKRVRCTASTKFQETTSYPMTTLCVLRGPQINK